MDYILDNRLSGVNKKIIQLFFLSVILGIVINFMGLIENPIITKSLIISSLFVGCGGIFIYLYHNRLTRLLFVWLLLVLYILIVGLLCGNITDTGNLLIYLNQDLRYLMYFTMGIIFASPAYLGSYHQLMRMLGIISIIFAVVALFTFDPEELMIETRGNTWTLSYYLWWASASCFAYWSAFTIISGKEKILGYGVLLSYFLLGLMFLKRSALINVVFIIFIAIFFRKNSILKTTFKFIGLCSILLIILYLFGKLSNLYSLSDLSDLLFNRFSMVKGLSSIDRIEEWNAYREGATWSQLIFGNGAGNYPTIKTPYLFNISSWKLNAMHLGLADILFKGGVFYLIFYVFLYINVFKRILLSKSFPQYIKICICVALANFLSLFYEGSWTYSTVLIGYTTPLIVAVTYNWKMGEISETTY